jgi:hypothetical protein
MVGFSPGVKPVCELDFSLPLNLLGEMLPLGLLS